MTTTDEPNTTIDLNRELEHDDARAAPYCDDELPQPEGNLAESPSEMKTATCGDSDPRSAHDVAEYGTAIYSTQESE